MAEKDIIEILQDEMGGKKKYNEFLKEIEEIRDTVKKVDDMLQPKDTYIIETYDEKGKKLKKIGEFKAPHREIKFY